MKFVRMENCWIYLLLRRYHLRGCTICFNVGGVFGLKKKRKKKDLFSFILLVKSCTCIFVKMYTVLSVNVYKLRYVVARQL